MTVLRRMQARQGQRGPALVALSGAGLMGRGLLRQLEVFPGLRPVLVVARRPEAGVAGWRCAGVSAGEIVVSDDPRVLRDTILSGQRGVCRRIEVLRELDMLDAFVECTGAVAFGAAAAQAAIEGGLHVIMMNAETDATVGCALKQQADAAGVVYTSADGDQPGVLKRLVDLVDGMGLEVVAAVNCKGFMDVHATPDSIAPWAQRQGTSLGMTTAFTDGTKMNIENAVLCNATGLRPEVRGMHGVRTTLSQALHDCATAFAGRGLVDYTLGGDFAGGVFVIGFGDDPVMIKPYLQYLKMGEGPHYLFFRPYHLCHMEAPISVAEAILDGEATIAPLGAPLAEVVAIAKRDLAPGERLDGMGGFSVYGQINVVSATRGLVPIGLCEGATVTRVIRRDEPIALEAVELVEDEVLWPLRRAQEALLRRAA